MSRFGIALVTALIALPAAALAADSLGREGAVRTLEVNHSTADTYLQYAGRVVIDNGVSLDEYRWGGTSCSNKGLSDARIAQLETALVQGLAITPRYQAGQGNNRCLVGFTVSLP